MSTIGFQNVIGLVALGDGLDKAWIIICGGIIFSMQCGFALLEAGGVRKKNSHVVWHKLVLNCLIGTMAWWLLGYAIAFGNPDGGFVGGDYFYAGNQWDQSQGEFVTQYGNWVFQASIAFVVVAITGGSISERVTLKATAIHTFIMIAFIYPFIVSWTWGGGWLVQDFDYRDFTGSGIVHCTGAYAGLAGLLVIGPRYNKFGNYKLVIKDEGKLERAPEAFKSEGPPVITSMQDLNKFRKRVMQDEYEEFGLTNVSYTMFGALILWFQFIFFNAGSSLFMQTEVSWLAAEKAAANTFFGGAGGGLIALVIKHPLINGLKAPRKFKDDAATVANALLGGMVANGAGMDTYEPWEAFVIGVIAGIFYTLACWLFEKLHLDDSLEAFQLHGVCGTVGVGCAAFFNHEDGIFHGNPTSGKVLGHQILGWLCISAWSFVISLIVWKTLQFAGILRLPLKTELIGYDFMDHADKVTIPNCQLVKEKAAGAKGSESANYELARRSTESANYELARRSTD